MQGQFQPDIKAILQAPLPGLTQTVNRGELYAIILLLEHIEPVAGECTIIYTDSQYCIDGYTAGADQQSATFNDDLWMRFFGQVSRHGRRLALIKVKSHMEVADATLRAPSSLKT